MGLSTFDSMRVSKAVVNTGYFITSPETMVGLCAGSKLLTCCAYIISETSACFLFISANSLKVCLTTGVELEICVPEPVVGGTGGSLVGHLIGEDNS